jgi:hypothetical protein
MCLVMKFLMLVENSLSNSKLYKMLLELFMKESLKIPISWLLSMWLKKWESTLNNLIRLGLVMNRFMFWNWCWSRPMQDYLSLRLLRLIKNYLKLNKERKLEVVLSLILSNTLKNVLSLFKLLVKSTLLQIRKEWEGMI